MPMFSISPLLHGYRCYVSQTTKPTNQQKALSQPDSFKTYLVCVLPCISLIISERKHCSVVIAMEGRVYGGWAWEHFRSAGTTWPEALLHHPELPLARDAKEELKARSTKGPV